MRPIRLSLRNFAGIQSGQGKDLIELDLEKAIPPDAQIVAIAGPNGAGKTTIMDNLHPYRLMPSRAGTPNPAAFSFYEHIVGGEGSKEFVWEHKGVRYQSVLRFRSTAKTKKAEAYLFVVDANGATTPWTDPATGAQSDGKCDTYDKAIEAILGKPEVFFQAQFSAQGKEPIGSMSASDVKRLIADMIGANRSSELSGKASEIVKALKPRLSVMQDEVSRTSAQIPDQGELARFIVESEAMIAAGRSALAALADRDTELVARIASAGKDAQQLEAARAQHKAFEAQLADALSERQAALGRIQSQRDSQQRAANEALQSAIAGGRSAQALVTSLQDELNRLEKVAATAPAVDAAVQFITQLTTERALKQARLDELTPQLLKLDQVQQGAETIASELASVKTDGEHLVNALAAAKATASLLSEVPCQGTDLSGQCKLLSQSNEAAGRIPETEIKLVAAREGYRAKSGQRAQLLTTLQELRVSAQEAQHIREEINRMDADRSSQQLVAATAQAVRQAQEQIPALRERLRVALDELAQANQRVQVEREKAGNVDRLLEDQVAQVNADHANRLQGLERIRASLPVISQADDVQSLMDQQQALRAQIRQSEAAQVVLGQELAQAQARQEQAVISREAVEIQRKRCEVLSGEIANWVLLSKALGTDGIIAMSIEDAGPAIAGIANALLEDCYGGRFALNLVTQKETQAGIAKETFRIEVEDNDRGERKFLELMSGGEKVWINECLVRAIALYMAQVADTRSLTLFSDESDGPLDPKRKRQYMAMKRAVIERGGYEREYLITQTPELLEMCDAVLDVATI